MLHETHWKWVVQPVSRTFFLTFDSLCNSLPVTVFCGFLAKYHLVFYISSFCSFPCCLYSVGPLHSDRQYDISASKEGFILSPVEGSQGDFKAFALAGVTFKVPLAPTYIHLHCPLVTKHFHIYKISVKCLAVVFSGSIWFKMRYQRTGWKAWVISF